MYWERKTLSRNVLRNRQVKALAKRWQAMNWGGIVDTVTNALSGQFLRESVTIKIDNPDGVLVVHVLRPHSNRRYNNSLDVLTQESGV